MRLAPLVVAACTALLLVASADCQAASAPKRPRSTLIVSRLGGAAAVDGWRYVAWGGGGGQVAVLDDSTGTTMRFGLGQDCDSIYPLSGSHGFFLVNCGIGGRAGSETRQFVLDVTTGEVTALGPDGWDLIGRNWLQGSGDDGVSPFAVYSNWRTGETVTEGLPSSGGARVPYDLDSAGLDAVAPPAREFLAGPDGALERVGRTIRLVTWSDSSRLYRCLAGCALVSMQGGLALWTDGAQRLVGYRPASGRLVSWRMPADAVVRGATARRVYFLTPRQFDPQYFRMKAFRWR